MRGFCQALIVCLWIVGFLISLYYEVEGREGQKPGGFGGVVVLLMIQAGVLLTYWEAGVFEAFGK
jgi:hypothetical protein